MQRKLSGSTGIAVVSLCGIWVLLVCLVNPLGDFPLNDDWAYGLAAKSLVEEGRLRMVGFVSMPLIAHVLWGALFCLPFGFSFTVLRFATLTAGIVGVVATYALLKEGGATPGRAFFGALLLAVNPLYFSLSYTFMTDVTFTAATVLSFLFISRWIRREKGLDLLIGTIFAFVAVLIRQLGIAIPIAFAFSCLTTGRVSMKRLLIALLPVFAVAGGYLAYEMCLRMSGEMPTLYHACTKRLLGRLRWYISVWVLIYGSNQGGKTLSYLGLFLFPFLMLTAVHQWRSKSVRQCVAGLSGLLVCVVVTMAILLWQNKLMPFFGNVLLDIGLGATPLRDVYVLQLPHLPRAPREFWIAVTAVAITGSVMLVFRFFRTLGRRRVEWTSGDRFKRRFFLSACLLYFAPLAMHGFFGRYLIFYIPSFMMLRTIAERPERPRIGKWSYIAATVLLIAYCAFSVGGTRDYLAWNRARWSALHFLTREAGISHKDIDGGFEFNGLYGYDPHFCATTGPDGKKRSWWWVRNDEYVISFGPIEGYKEVRRYSYNRLIPPGTGAILVLRRISI